MEMLRGISILSIVVSIISFFRGFYMLTVYNNGEFALDEAKNAPVGGDAYNLIINASTASGYFILFGSLLMVAVLTEILLSVKRQERYALDGVKPTKAEIPTMLEKLKQ